MYYARTCLPPTPAVGLVLRQGRRNVLEPRSSWYVPRRCSVLVEYKHGHEACEETTVAGATTTKQLVRCRSTSAESEARQQQRMVWQAGTLGGFVARGFPTSTRKHFQTVCSFRRTRRGAESRAHTAQNQATQSAFRAHYVLAIAVSTELLLSALVSR